MPVMSAPSTNADRLPAYNAVNSAMHNIDNVLNRAEARGVELEPLLTTFREVWRGLR